MPEDKPRVLVIFDQATACRACDQVLSAHGFETVVCQDGARGVALFRDQRPDAVLVDYHLPDIPGTEVLKRIGQIDPLVPAIMVTGRATLETAMAAIKLGAYDFMPMPFTPDELTAAVKGALKRRALNLETQRLKEEKEALERNFVTFVTHQLRSPLVAMAQFFEVLVSGAAGPLSQKQQDIIEKIYDRLQDMLTLINNWLDLSRVKAGVIVERLAPLEAAAFTAKVVADHQPIAEAAGASLDWRPPAGEVMITADGESLAQALANLITNAIKYAGGEDRPAVVEVGLKVKNGQAVISVADNGPGIPQEFIPFLFDEFSRAKQRGKKTAGSGLGLALANRIVVEHGGVITVDTREGHGTTFSIILPLAKEG